MLSSQNRKENIVSIPVFLKFCFCLSIYHHHLPVTQLGGLWVCVNLKPLFALLSILLASDKKASLYQLKQIKELLDLCNLKDEG